MTAQLITDQARLRLPQSDELSVFCEDLFASLPRSDQRRWAEVYLRGLLSVPGRKSTRRISDQVVGWRAEQSLQQFVNQSPWQWNSVRRMLAHHASVIRPRAWLVHEAIFPKNGHNSVGVAKQYAPSIGRTLNCQLGLAVSLASDVDRYMVNWRLVLPQCWDRDRERRTRARVPDEVRHHPHWRYVAEAVDEMTLGWGLRPAPVVWNAVSQETGPLLRDLTTRRLPYIVQVSADTPVLAAQAASDTTRMLTAGELAEISASRRHLMVGVRDRLRDTGSSTPFSLLSVCDLCPLELRVHITSACPHGGTRRVLARWSWRGSSVRLDGVWLTNLAKARLSQLVDLVELSPRACQEDMATLRNDFGLQDFEGRSYAGWHHHVTLVSAAHTYRMLQRTRK
jgi:hypothetical protein